MAGTGQHIFITIKAHGRVAPEPERQLKSYTNRIPVCALTNTTATSEPIDEEDAVNQQHPRSLRDTMQQEVLME